VNEQELARAFGPRWGVPAAAVTHVPEGGHLGTGLIEPTSLLGALAQRGVGGTAMIAVVALGGVALALAGRFRILTGFANPLSTPLLEQGRCEYLSLTFFDAVRHLRAMPPDCVMVRLAPPDPRGRCSYGWAAGFTPELVDIARDRGVPILAEIDLDMPRSDGAGALAVDEITAACMAGGKAAIDAPLPTSRHADAIARHLAPFVPDGATLQVGIGSVPDSVVERLPARDLGIHTEVLSRGLARLALGGRASGARKSEDDGLAVCTIASRDEEVRELLGQTGRAEVRSASRVLDPRIIARHHRMRCINSALAVDLHGQVNAETLGRSQVAGVGGQLDFLRGAGLADDGLRIITLASVTSSGASRIVIGHPPGSVVTATRYDVDLVVTEHGAAPLRDRSDAERARALIAIADPAHRGELAKAC
jgi:4-hydroxybutyrate CoA-transferase